MSDLKLMMEDELKGLEFIQPGFLLKTLKGGAVNSSYYLQTSKNSYFVKTFDSDKVALLDRKNLFDIQLELAFKGLAVKPVYLSKTCNFQIDQWLDIPTLDHVDVPSLTTTRGLASALSTLHKTQIEAPKLDLPCQWKHYLGVTNTSVSLLEQQTLERYAAIWHQACATKAVFCHNDLALSHVTHSQPSIIFDWEYCSLSCPYFDLASCVAINGLGAADEASLYAFYAQFSEQRLSEVIKKVFVMKPLVELTNKLWYRAFFQSK
jgi:thiamine kinase-like enzyme